MTATVDISRIPGDLNGEWFYNAISWHQDNVCTAHGVQFATWWGPDKVVNIGRRLLPDGAWSVKRLPNTSGYSFSTAAADLHNTLAVAVDSEGYIHLAGNMHNDSLRYARSGAPYDHTSMFMAAPMVGTEENSVTYPQFVYMPDGELLLFYRNGSSGAGDVYLNAYDPVTRTWTRRAKLLDGLASSESPYLSRVAVDHAGRLHAFVIWRLDLGSATNTDLSYLTSDDNGVTWTQADGTPYSLPITHATIEVVVPSDDNSGLLNQTGCDGDMASRPHCAAQYLDDNGRLQVHHVWWDGSVWHNQVVSGFAAGESFSRPSVVCPDDGSTYVIYNGQHGPTGTPRSLWAHDVTAGAIGPGFELSRLFGSGSEVTFDVRAMRERGEMYVLTPNAVSSGSTSGRWNHVDDWARQWGGVQRFDLDEIADFKAGLVALPDVNPTATATGTTASLPISGPDLFYRVTATGSTGTVTAREARAGQTDVVLTAFTLTGTEVSTPWIPLRLTGDGTITLEGTGPAGTLLEVGQIDGVTPPAPEPAGLAGVIKYTIDAQEFVVVIA